ncbi:hypothetical protein Tco_0258149 [Tanacetum coccineum]
MLHTAPENINQAETNAENAQFDDDEFINIFSTPIQEQGERWTKDHPLEQVIGNPSQSVRTRHSDHAGCLDSRKSTSGGIQFLGGDNSMAENSAHRLWLPL